MNSDNDMPAELLRFGPPQPDMPKFTKDELERLASEPFSCLLQEDVLSDDEKMRCLQIANRVFDYWAWLAQVAVDEIGRGDGMSEKDNGFVPGQIYAVHANHLDRNVLLGYCFAESEEDIRAFYDDDKAYGIEITVVLPVKIPTGYAEQRATLIEQRNNLQQQINKLNMQISRRSTK